MKKIITKIRELEKKYDTDELGNYLIDIVKYENNPKQYESEFSKHLFSKDWYLRKVAVYCLLCTLQIDQINYRNKAIEFVKNIEEDDEVRRWSASGLSVTYQNSKDIELLKLFIEVVENPNDDEDIKESLLSAALRVYGLTSRDQLFRNNKISPELEEMYKTYEKEIEEIKKMVKENCA